jgi:hypothetical protein
VYGGVGIASQLSKLYLGMGRASDQSYDVIRARLWEDKSVNPGEVELGRSGSQTTYYKTISVSEGCRDLITQAGCERLGAKSQIQHLLAVTKCQL